MLNFNFFFFLTFQVLFSCGADGSMFAFDVEGLVGQEMQGSKETKVVVDPRMAALGGGGSGARGGAALSMFASARHFNGAAVLCSREEVANSMAQITDMTKRIEDMRAETGYTLHRMETEWQEKMRLQTDKMEEGLTVERVRRYGESVHHYMMINIPVLCVWHENMYTEN